MNQAQVIRDCPVCGSGESAPRLQKGELRLVRCRKCSMVYASPVPEDFLSGEYYDREGAGYYLSPAKLQGDYAPVRFARELRIFRRHCRGGDVLDVGCSTGGFLHELRRRFPEMYRTLGMDASGPPLDYAESQGVPVLRGDFLKHDFAGKQFDAIAFWAVLEHLGKPRDFLDKAATLLRPEGRCFVLVPNLKSLAARVLGRRYRYFYPQHVNYFTRRTLEEITRERFIVESVHCTHFNPMLIWQDLRSGGREVSNTERAALLGRTTAMKQNAWLKPVKTVYWLAEKSLGAAGLADNLVVVLRPR